MEEKTCSVQNGRCTCNQGLHPDGTGNCVGKFMHYHGLVPNHLSWQFHISSGIFCSKATDGQIITVNGCKCLSWVGLAIIMLPQCEPNAKVEYAEHPVCFPK